MRVCIVGTGYVGLVSGACLAELGHEVACVDIDPDKVTMINAGQTPIYEEGLSELLSRHAGRNLQATTDLSEGMAAADVVLICVGTPFDGNSIDLSYVLAVAQEIGGHLSGRDSYCVVAVKSTVVPGTTTGPVREALERASGLRAGDDFGLGMNPEFLAEGTAVHDFMRPDRIIVGAIDDRSATQLARLYSTFDQTPIIRTNPSTAEMTKYAANAFMATMISFSNEVADYCESMSGVDVADVMAGLHEMKQLNTIDDSGTRHRASACALLWAGCGFGGSCFPKDVKALVSNAEKRGVDSELLRSVLRVNNARPGRMIEKLQAHFDDVKDLKVTILGLSFKPGTDDVRESPALAIIEGLISLGAHVICHDPVALESGRVALADRGIDLADIEFESDINQALAECAAVLLVTSWPLYAGVPELLSKRADAPLVVDGRRMLSASDCARYEGIGLRTA